MDIIFKRESYLSDSISIIALSVSLVLSYYFLPYYFPKFILDSSALMLLMLAIHIGIWLLIVVHFYNSYKTILIVSDDRIEVKYRKSGWICAWNEIKEWTATVDVEGSHEIILTTNDFNYHKLPSEIIGVKSYRLQIKSILHEHCGEPTMLNIWNASDSPNG